MLHPKQNGHSRTDFIFQINPNDYLYPAEYTPKFELQRTIVMQDGNKYPSVDSMRLFEVFLKLRARDLKFYLYIITMLECNNKPIRVPMQELRGLFKEKTTVEVFTGFDRLCKAGLLIKQEHARSCYFVNPAFAWKGERAQYLDVSTLPLQS